MNLKRFGLAVIVLADMMMVSLSVNAKPLDKVVFETNWFAQAEHGGFYQAKAEGIYKKYGLDVELKMGGPQVNGMQLLLAGRVDLMLGYALSNFQAVSQGLPVVTVATTFQKDPQAIIAHPNIKSLQELADKKIPVYLGATSYSSFFPWLKSKYGFSNSQGRPYTFSVAPFLANPNVAQQGYVTSEPYAIEKGGVKPKVFLLADYGYIPYAETIETTRKMLKERPDVIKRFVQASMEGWASYLKNPAPGNRLIKQANPEMTNGQLRYSLAMMKKYHLLDGGQAATQGIGSMTRQRWEKTYEFMKKAHLLKKPVNVNDVYSLDYLPAKPVLVH